MPAPFGQFAPQKPPYNGLAITALVLGLLCCVPLVGVILGVIALAQIRKTGQRGKGLAVAGIALSTIGTLLTVLFFTTGGWTSFKGGFEEGLRETDATATLQPGDCFDRPGDWDGVEEDAQADLIEEVSCDVPHDGEAFARFDLSEDAYPGQDGVIDEADRRCVAHLSRYAMDAWKLAPEAADYFYNYPSQAAWSLGDRSVVCAVAAEEGQLAGPVRLDETVLGGDQLAYLEPVAGLNTALAGAPFAGVDEDLAAHQEWAAEVTGELSAVSRALRDHDWDPGASPAAGQLADQVDVARGLWEELDSARSADEFRVGWSAALFALTDRTDGAKDLRKALKLSTERPEADSDTVTPAGAL
ncbi:DUF4190 domain-containing protein [Streptomyces sp. NPDC056600]|uniref:DUF4190 domain-containing protein n=1 Tax=Streptomyces sp. NPDC056600 TaxID=3345874 RepID=UPI0036A29E3E